MRTCISLFGLLLLTLALAASVDRKESMERDVKESFLVERDSTTGRIASVYLHTPYAHVQNQDFTINNKQKQG